jgi:hypothetical protein
MSGNLIIPRVEVKWGDMNLSSYNGVGGVAYPQNEPLVYQVEAILNAQMNGPSATMMWSPAGAAFKAYEYCLENLMTEDITTRFYYDNGKSITFKWIWSGQAVTYGNDMSVRVSLSTKLAGVANGTIRSVAVNHSIKPSKKSQAIKKLATVYDIDPKLVSLTPCAMKDMDKATFNNYYAKDASFGAAVVNFASENGNTVFAHNIDGEGMVIMCPFYYDDSQTVIDARSIPKNASPNPGQRYGYIIGPSIINTIQRVVQWRPPQESRTRNAATTSKPIPGKDKKNRQSNKKEANPVPTTKNEELDQKSTSSPVGSSTGISISVNNADDPMVAEKKTAKELEAASTMTFMTFMVPVLVGIKPHDIIYVPSLSGNYIEDWIVADVNYGQTDGGVSIGVTATRIYGSADLMNKAQGQKFQNYVKNNLKTLEDWENYAWYTEPPNTTSGPATSVSNTAPAANTTVPGFKPARGGDFVDM